MFAPFPIFSLGGGGGGGGGDCPPPPPGSTSLHSQDPVQMAQSRQDIDNSTRSSSTRFISLQYFARSLITSTVNENFENYITSQLTDEMGIIVKGLREGIFSFIIIGKIYGNFQGNLKSWSGAISLKYASTYCPQCSHFCEWKKGMISIVLDFHYCSFFFFWLLPFSWWPKMCQ